MCVEFYGVVEGRFDEFWRVVMQIFGWWDGYTVIAQLEILCFV